MSDSVRLSKPHASALRWRRMNGVLGVIATLVVLGGFFPSLAQAQKNINFDADGGSVTSTLVFGDRSFISPDVYSFFVPAAGEQIRVETSNNGNLDTTIRVIGPDARIDLFDDDGAPNLASRLVFTAADAGVYLVVVSSFSGNPGGGTYTLNFARGAAALQPLSALTLDPGQGKSMLAVANPVEEKPAQAHQP